MPVFLRSWRPCTSHAREKARAKRSVSGGAASDRSGTAPLWGPVPPAERRGVREREWRVRFYLGHRLPGGFWGGVSTYARRPHHAVRQAARATGGIGCAAYVVLGVVLVLSITYWYISVPVLVLTAIAVGVTVHRQHVRQRQAAT